ncbi:hypothetical protein UU5_01277 [Rhodanobacter sp. 115]|nr:hypothetical protein UU5_01277 [Rhodanobacter sp. 115]
MVSDFTRCVIDSYYTNIIVGKPILTLSPMRDVRHGLDFRIKTNYPAAESTEIQYLACCLMHLGNFTPPDPLGEQRQLMLGRLIKQKLAAVLVEDGEPLRARSACRREPLLGLVVIQCQIFGRRRVQHLVDAQHDM